jgi:putative ABC transport system permease protein
VGSLFYILVEGGIRHDPLRAVVALAAVAFGTALLVATHLIGVGSSAALAANAELGLHADLRIVESGRGLDERIFARIRALPEVADARPILLGDAAVAARPNDSALGETVRIAGVDLLQPIAGPSAKEGLPGPFAARGTTIDPAVVLGGGGAIVSARLARQSGLRVGARFDALASGRRTSLRVAQIIAPDAVGLDSDTVFVDIVTAQAMFGRHGFLDRIDCIVTGDISAASARIASLLPPGARVERPRAPATGLARLTGGLRRNFAWLALVTLMLAALLVYDAVGTSVTLRRREIAIVRSLGATRRTIFAAFLAEGALQGLFGSLLGALAGASITAFVLPTLTSGLGTGAATAVDDAMPSTIAVGVATGILIGAFCAARPALRAMRVAPASALGFAAAPLMTERRATFGVAGLSALIALASDLLRRASERAAPAAWLAALELRATRQRTAIALAALALAAANAIGYVITSTSFGAATLAWAAAALPGDLEISAAHLGDADTDTLPATALARIRRVAGVATATPARSFDVVAIGQGVLELRGDDASAPHSGPSPVPYARETPAFVTQPLARRLHVRLGDRLTIATPSGNVRLRVTGVPDDFERTEGAAIVPFASSARWFNDDRPDTIQVNVNSTVEPYRVRSAIVRALAPLRLGIQTTRELRAAAVALLGRSLSIANAFAFVTLAIALAALGAALGALVLERKPQIATLRYVGASRRFVMQMVLCEAAVVAALACMLGLFAGGLTAIVALDAIGSEMFGRGIPLHVSAGGVSLVLALTFLAGILAGLPAARAAGRIAADAGAAS